MKLFQIYGKMMFAKLKQSKWAIRMVPECDRAGCCTIASTAQENGTVSVNLLLTTASHASFVVDDR